jgi:hypothetical protein
MDKIHYQTDQEDLFRLCDGQMFTLYDDANIKSAASDTFTRELLSQHKPDKDHFMLHVVAMGDQETYGPNKNGDGFPKEALEKFHPSFVSDGCFFREHKNRCQETQGIGTIKASAFNPKMRRVELVVHGNKKKASAEYEKAKSGKALSFSMSCRVPYDICSCCEKKASSPRNYCEHLSDSMLQYLPEFKKYAYAINDRPKFFDISVVANPADRIAHYLDYAFDDQEKSASANKGIITGTEWASFEGVKLPGEHISSWNFKEHEMLTKLAACEKYILDTFIYKKSATTDAKASFVRNILPQAFTGDELNDTEISKLRTLQVGTVFGELAKRATLLPFNSFAAYVTGRTMEDVSNDPVTKRACCMLSSIFNKLINSDSGCDLDKMFNAGSNYSCEQDPGNDDEVQKFMDAVSEKFCIKTAPVSSRVITVTISKGASTKAPKEGNIVLTDNFEKRALALAEIYGVYKLNAMLDIKERHTDEIDEPQYLLAVGQNFEL